MKIIARYNPPPKPPLLSRRPLMSDELKANAALLTEALDALTSCDNADYRIDMMLAYRPKIVLTLRALLSLLTAYQARAEAAEARVKAYEDALDPNQTKHVYIGEIKNEDGRTIAWTATKETMAMIRARASRIMKEAPDGR